MVWVPTPGTAGHLYQRYTVHERAVVFQVNFCVSRCLADQTILLMPGGEGRRRRGLHGVPCHAKRYTVMREGFLFFLYFNNLFWVRGGGDAKKTLMHCFDIFYFCFILFLTQGPQP